MRIKGLFFVLLACALSAVSFSSCDDDDDKALSTVVTELSFKDIDIVEDSIKGEITWKTPNGSHLIKSWIIYSSSNGTSRESLLAKVDSDKKSYVFENHIKYVKYFIVVAELLSGEEDVNYASVLVVDKTINSPDIEGVYILNSGNGGSSNASLAFYDYQSQGFVYKVFQTQNGKGLGDTAQDMVVYGSKMYIAVYGSNLIYVTDKQGKEIKVIRPETGKGRPRNLTAHNGKLYASMYDGYLAKIDTTSYEIEASVKVGRYPEYVRVANNKLYVANSGGMDYNNELGYDKTVSVVNVNTFEKEKDIPVLINPQVMAVGGDDNLYVISTGDYGVTVSNTLQKIDTKTDAVETLFNATWMAVSGNKLYYIYAQWNAGDPTYGVYDIKTKTNESFITDGTTFAASPYCISVDAENDYVYIGTSDYRTNGDMYVFGTNGKLVKTFDTGGLNPMGAYYVK